MFAETVSKKDKNLEWNHNLINFSCTEHYISCITIWKKMMSASVSSERIKFLI